MDEKEIKKLFGKKIKIRRQNKNLTQANLGELAGINQRQVALIEAGKSFPSLKTLIKFAQIFSCHISDLFCFENLQDSSVLTEEILKIINKSNQNQIKTIYTIAKELI